MDEQCPDPLILETYDFDTSVSYEWYLKFLNYVNENLVSWNQYDQFETALLRKYNAHYSSDGWGIRFATLEDKLEFILTYS